MRVLSKTRAQINKVIVDRFSEFATKLPDEEIKKSCLNPYFHLLCTLLFSPFEFLAFRII